MRVVLALVSSRPRRTALLSKSLNQPTDRTSVTEARAASFRPEGCCSNLGRFSLCPVIRDLHSLVVSLCALGTKQACHDIVKDPLLDRVQLRTRSGRLTNYQEGVDQFRDFIAAET